MMPNQKSITVCVRSFIVLWIVAQLGCVPITPPRQSFERVVETRIIGGRIEESIIQKTFKVRWLVPVNPQGDSLPYTQFTRYYFREKRDYELDDVNAGISKIENSHRPKITGTNERFIPIYNSSLWVCLVQEIVDIDIVNTLVIVLDKHKMRNEFFVKDCLRNEGRCWAIDWEDGHTKVLRIHTKGGTIKYDVKSDKRIK